MKKSILLIALMLLPLVASAEEVEIDGLWYNLDTNEKTAQVIQYKNNVKYSGDVVIPETVTDEEAILYSVTSIGTWAFTECRDMTSIEIPSSVKNINGHAFQNCSGLTSIEIPNSLTIIDEAVFAGCTGLTSIEIPSSVTSIGTWAFEGCSGLTSIIIPSSVMSIENQAFSSCIGLTSISVESGNTVYDSRDNCNAIIETATNNLIAGCKNTIIPNGITSIGDYAFDGCSGLTSIEIPNSVTSIGECAFADCSGLTSVNIPGGVTSIGVYAFYGCSSLTSIMIPSSVTNIGRGVLVLCSNLAFISVESGNPVYDSRDNCNAIIETATNNLIAGCKNTIIPNGITSIGDNAFFGCTGLTTIEIPNTVTSIGSGTFYYCSGLTSVIIPSSVTSIGQSAICYCTGLTTIEIPNTMTSISNFTFENCSGLTSVIVPSSVTSVGGAAFKGCTSLTDFYCYAESVPTTRTDTFKNSSCSSATLHVPEASVESYQSADRWKDFGNIVALLSCAKPTITQANGKLHFDCETEGAELVPVVSFTQQQLINGNELELGGTFTISVYAVKEGYINSEVATMVINMSQMGDANADGEINAADITAVVNAILGK